MEGGRGGHLLPVRSFMVTTASSIISWYVWLPFLAFFAGAAASLPPFGLRIRYFSATGMSRFGALRCRLLEPSEPGAGERLLFVAFPHVCFSFKLLLLHILHAAVVVVASNFLSAAGVESATSSSGGVADAAGGLAVAAAGATAAIGSIAIIDKVHRRRHRRYPLYPPSARSWFSRVVRTVLFKCAPLFVTVLLTWHEGRWRFSRVGTMAKASRRGTCRTFPHVPSVPSVPSAAALVLRYQAA